MTSTRNLTHGGRDLSPQVSETFLENPFSSERSYEEEEEEEEEDPYEYPRGLEEEEGSSSPSILLRDYSAYGGSQLNLLSSRQTSTIADPFITDAEFSPFGGYPLTSFPLQLDEKEPDDYLHNPDPIEDQIYDRNRFLYDFKNMDKRSAGGFFGLIIMLCGIIAIFVILPVLTYSGVTTHSKPVGETYETLTDYSYPTMSSLRINLVDSDTPKAAHTRKAKDGTEWDLVFSDEFNLEGRTFYDGSDQFWYGADFNYASTEDLEWYDPDAITTANGTLQIKLDAIKQHDLFYRSGMLHSWNKLCFTQGILEFSAKLPNRGETLGIWPGLWSMGNLGRPGYMATTDGTWPYSYEGCDAGITANQSSSDGISYLKGQKLNSCTCEGEDHPNRGTGRGAPEIDVLEAENDSTKKQGIASQSLQIAPMDIWYYADYSFCEIHNSSVTTMNSYTGGPFQQAVSATTTLNNTWYEKGSVPSFQKYSYEYLNDNDDGYIRWFVGDDPTFTMHAYALSPNGNVDWRRISKEPMSIIVNMGLSNSWSYIDWKALNFPLTFEIDYVRIYQPPGNISLTCDPEDYPTLDYIADHTNAYENYNLTSWKDAGYSYPKHKLNGC